MEISRHMLQLFLLIGLCGYAHGAEKLLGSLVTQDHDVSGDVYAIGLHRILIKDFTYDGQGPDAFFYVGKSGSPSASGLKLPDETGAETPLRQYSNEDIILSLPENYPVDSLRWLSVYCRQFTVDFGNLMFPTISRDEIPAPVDVGQFSQLAHQVSSGQVTLLDERRMLINALYYDGLGPAAYFWACTTDTPDLQCTKVPDENGRTERALAYDGNKNIIITLPENRKWGSADVRSLSLYCVDFEQNFGTVLTSGTYNLPPFLADEPPSVLMNCEKMSDALNVAWEVDGTDLVVEMVGAIDATAGYMSFGVSGADDSVKMVDGDVVVASYVSEPKVEDYILGSKAFCSGSTGVCPDGRVGGAANVELLMSNKENGITTIKFKRPLNTGDADGDRNVVVNADRYFIWALGKFDSEGLVTRHDTRDGLKLRLDREGMRNCEAVTPPSDEKVEPWSENLIRLDKLAVPEISVKIGPTGGSKGFSAITGEQSWGIAWYLNGLLIPRLIIRRGDTVTFKVYGGKDTTNTAKYHPFYITNDKLGGYAGKTEQQKASLRILAGPAEGPYCEFVEDSAKKPETFSSFLSYAASLTEECEEGNPGSFQWTPDANTPDLVYYQCYTHQRLGWKIEVVDEYPDDMSGVSKVSTLSVLAVLLVALMTVFCTA